MASPRKRRSKKSKSTIRTPRKGGTDKKVRGRSSEGASSESGRVRRVKQTERGKTRTERGKTRTERSKTRTERGKRSSRDARSSQIRLPSKSLQDSERLSELQADLNVATEIQANLLPKKIPRLDGFDISAYYRPSKDVGGDYYDFLEIDDQTLGLIVADVSGKGVSGSMVMTMFRSVLRMHAKGCARAAEPLIHTNRQMAEDIKRGMFVTCYYILLEHNAEGASVRVCSAGHNPLVYWRKKTGKCHLINPKGIAIGFDKGPVFENALQEQRFPLEPGDRLVAYTDGVVEAMNEKDEEYGDDRLVRLVQDHTDRTSGQFINRVIQDVEEFSGTAPQSDDITILTLRYLGGEDE